MGPSEKTRQYFGHSNQIISHKKSIAQAQRVGDHEIFPLFIRVTFGAQVEKNQILIQFLQYCF